MNDTERIKHIPPDDWSEEIIAALGAFPAGLNFILRSRLEGEKNPRGENVLGAFARHPALAKAFLTFNAHVAVNSSLSIRVRELVILRVSWLNCSEYEYTQHLILARRAGLTDQDIELTQVARSADGVSHQDGLVLRAVDELYFDTRISDKTWPLLQQHFDVQQLMDFLFLAGCYTTLAMVLNSMGLPLESGVTPLDPETRERLYVKRNWISAGPEWNSL
ncbi:carboxymuconolactone decarboxylase family protein [Stenotrophobium rhamnosiphilum]|uniref:Carboxymuconolactone decarboxylase family protein n=1 Tax=Stenotrophobium rhamnosiphilum TaxID=2029166 RepID=A0A2T5MH33_9GAMM|nr:carboxymuconolactone decarboxylase family protein [Stenotrophobium rhamnosiphilum]PTU31886.1 carboxymuconolactone decarboxylase family protein [Stenotrophobium rhamnosiphilum]